MPPSQTDIFRALDRVCDELNAITDGASDWSEPDVGPLTITFPTASITHTQAPEPSPTTACLYYSTNDGGWKHSHGLAGKH